MSRWLWAVLVVGIVFRVLFLAAPIDVADSDSVHRYDPQAKNLLAGRGFSSSVAAPFEGDVFDQPGYGSFLALVYLLGRGNLLALGVAQTLLELATVVLACRICDELGLPQLAGRLAAVAGLLCTLVVCFNRQVLTEVLATLTITLTVYAVVRARHRGPWSWALAGVAAGIALLVRGDQIPGVLLLGVASLLAGAKRLGVLAMAAALAVTLTPWTVRTYLETSAIRPLGGVAEQADRPYIRWLDTWVVTRAEEKKAWHLEHPSAEIDYAALASEARRTEPLRVVFFVPAARLISIWLHHNDYIPGGRRGLVFKPLNSLILAFSLGGIVSAAARKRYLLLFPLAIIVGRSVLPIASALGTEPRYLVEAMPCCFVFAGYAAAGLLERWAPVLRPIGRQRAVDREMREDSPVRSALEPS